MRVNARAREAARLEGLLVGYSAGAILCVALREARRLSNGRNVITVLPDDGYKYLRTNLYTDKEDRTPCVSLSLF